VTAKEKALIVLWRLACFKDELKAKIVEFPNLIEGVWLTAMSDLPEEVLVCATKLMVVSSTAPLEAAISHVTFNYITKYLFNMANLCDIRLYHHLKVFWRSLRNLKLCPQPNPLNPCMKPQPSP
jgi:hypothetical protein